MSNKTLPSVEEPVITAPPAKSSPDLSSEIVLNIARQPGDRVRAVRVWGDHYRCNWIAPKNRLDFLETFFVRQSQFLHVTKGPDGSLLIRKVGGDN